MAVQTPMNSDNVSLTTELVCVLVDARCGVLLATYSNLAKRLSAEGLHPLAAVNCYDWTDVCQLANVSTYPLIRVYRPDTDPLDYNGYLSNAALYATIKLYVCFFTAVLTLCLQCFGTVGWAAGRASGL